MRTFIPFIVNDEMSLLESEIKGRDVVIETEFCDPNATRWWSKYEVWAFISIYFDEVCQCILSANVVGDVPENGARITRLIALISNDEHRAKLQLEVRIVALVCMPLVESTYVLEGKGPLATMAYKIIKRIEYWFRVHNVDLTYPGKDYYIGIEQAINEYVDACGVPLADVKNSVRESIVPCIDYFTSRILGMLDTDLALYKILRYMNPFEHKLLVADGTLSANVFCDDVKQLKRFSAADVNSMMLEYSEYCMTTSTLPNVTHKEMPGAIELFWKEHHNLFPFISMFARYAMTIITSSASAERAFSILKSTFNPKQDKANEDYVMSACMQQFNERTL